MQGGTYVKRYAIWTGNSYFMFCWLTFGRKQTRVGGGVFTMLDHPGMCRFHGMLFAPKF